MITIGMASYGNPEQVWWTIQALRMYQDVVGCEILVIDNQGNEDVKKAVKGCKARYELMNEVNGTGPARNAIFDRANGDFVLVIDSHVLLWADAIKNLKVWLSENWEEAKNLIHGPLVLSGLQIAYTHYDDQWRSDMWGVWGKSKNESELGTEPIEIQMMGCGLFGCRKDSWLGFCRQAKGFDGVEGVIHEKYRRAGRRVICLPFLKWVHKFHDKGSKVPYPLLLDDKIRNFLLGFAEIDLDPAPIYEHFGRERVTKIASNIASKRLAVE